MTGQVRPVAVALLLVAAGALAPATLAAQKDPPAGAIADKRSDLKEVQERIRDLQKDIARSEESRDEALEALSAAEQAISAGNRHLRELAASRSAAEAELARVAEAGRQLESGIRSQQAGLEKLLNRYYISGQALGLRHMLSGSDPNQLTRDLYYLKQLSRSEADLIDQLRRSLSEQKTLLEQARATRDDLAAIEAEQRREAATLAEQQRKRRQVLADLSQRLRSQRQEVGNLKRDEARLARLIDGLAELARKQAAAAEKARRLALQAEERKRQQEHNAASQESRPAAAEPAANAPARAAAPVARVDETPQASSGGTPFAQLRGRLKLPIRGELMNRYGSPRADGGSSWRGVFIRAAAGAEVKAIADGRVAFADWLRGFGNLMIVDHGGEYLSIYGYNESLLRGVGDTVRAGDAIAAVGNSGGSEETGLYFELRHRGQPIDPMRWVSLR